MARFRVFVLIQALVAAVCVFAVGIPSRAASDWRLALAFLGALVVMGLFEVWLPRGDSADMSGPIAFAAAATLAPEAFYIVLLLSRATVYALRWAKYDGWSALADAGRRTLSASAAVLVLRGLGAWPHPGSAEDYRTYLVILGGAAAYFVLEFLLGQIRSSVRLRSSLASLLLGNLRLQGWMGAAEMSAAILAVVLQTAMGAWSLIIVVALLLVMRQSFALLLDVRAAYRATVEVLARAIEAQNPERRGHSQRVAALSGQAARELGFHGRSLENLTYAALFHDVGNLGDASRDQEEQSRSSADILSQVSLLAGAIPVLRILDLSGEAGASPEEEALVSAYLVARMSEFDDVLSGVPRPKEGAASERIGARLYAETRATADRVVLRVQGRADVVIGDFGEPLTEALL